MKIELSELDFSLFVKQQVVEIRTEHAFCIDFTDGYLMIECFWRLRNQKGIVCGSEERKRLNASFSIDAYEEATKHLRNKSITNVYHIKATSDLIVEFDEEMYLDIFSDSSIYEGWNLCGPGTFHVWSLPGGEYTYVL